ncbi:MAG: DUF3578 domain-containing protein, partial [Bacteroidetes bacterium]|nr:DUF3578 domain-containing protein [Bacteroidota bacterium]
FLKKNIIKGLEYVDQNEIDKISGIETSVWNMVLLKIFSIYYPDRFLMIGDPKVIIECGKSIGISGVELKSTNSVLINHLCRKKLNETKEFSNWNFEKIGTLIWQTFKDTSKRDYYIIGSKYGEKADKDVFPEMLRRSVIATGFASELDLTEYFNENHSVIKEFLQTHNEETKSINALKYFLSLKPGDLVAVKSDGSPKGKEGYLAIVGIAEVISKDGKVYEHDPGGLGHVINVKYLDAPIFKELSLGGYGRTIHKLTNDEHIKLIFKSNNEISFFDELNRFLEQADTSDLRTSHFLKRYLGFEVKVSFGQGNLSKIPWIAFLDEADTVQQGIYPVYLYYKERKLLILAYGVSETHNSNRSWNFSNVKTIKEYFRENNFGEPERYGNSFLYKSYDINQGIEKDMINSDLNNLISIYKTTITPNPPSKPYEPFQYNKFINQVSLSGLFFSEKVSLRLICSLLTKPFVILTGLSGSGKTKLAQAFTMWICEDESQYCLLPVGADWTNREPLLGYPNALQKEEYVKPDNRIIDLLIQASKNTEKPYFMILDEMNLSHVERYFADFLSIMESKNALELYTGSLRKSSDNLEIPLEIAWPKNLFIIGTVNIDETTYMFSPKVLDRANVIEFMVTADEMKSYLNSNISLNLKNLEKGGANMARDFLIIAVDESIKTNDLTEINKTLLSFFTDLKETGAEFGYRSASEILRFSGIMNKIEPNWSMSEIVDAAIMQKLLPKLHGSRRKLEPVLKTLAGKCFSETISYEQIVKDLEQAKGKIEDLQKVIYPISLDKIIRMYKRLEQNGFTSYAEA